MEKRGQAATEFLTTYGWAIVILIMVTAAILSLGVFSPKAPNECKTEAPFNCKDVVFREGGFQVNLQVPNLLDAEVDEANVKINNIQCTNVKVQGNAINDFNLKEGENKITCYGDVNKIKENNLVKAEVSLIYKSESNLEHNIKVLASGQVEKGSYANNFDSSAILSFNFDEDSSSNVIDNGYYGNNGVLQGPNIASSNCISKNCYEFDDGDIIRVPNTNSLNPTNKMSIEVWVYPYDFAGARIVYKNRDDPSNSGGFLLYQQGDQLDFGLRGNGIRFDGITGSILRRNRWQHIAATWEQSSLRDSNNVVIYRDGIKVLTRDAININSVSNIQDLSISNTVESFNGLLDNIRIYNRVLTPEEVAQHYKNLKP